MSGSVALEELRALFTGVPAEDGEGWATSPCYTVPLAFELARRCDAQTEYSLRTILYDTTPCDDIPDAALSAIQLAVQRYRTHRQLQKKRSSL